MLVRPARPWGRVGNPGTKKGHADLKSRRVSEAEQKEEDALQLPWSPEHLPRVPVAGHPGSQTGLVARKAGQADWHGKRSPSISISDSSILGSQDNQAPWLPTRSSTGALREKLEVEGKRVESRIR